MLEQTKEVLDILIKTKEMESKSWKPTNAITNFSRLIVKFALQKSYKQIREEKGLKKKEPISSHLSDDELRKILNIERQVVMFLKKWMTYKEIKKLQLVAY